MQTYMNKRKTPDRAVPPVQEAAPSRSEMLHMSGAGAPQPMSPQLREKFEPGFGADFSNIRISRGHIPEEMGVEAVAQGTDILLDEGAGMDVLGHELAHVVQQAQGRVAGGFPVVENAALEQEADVMGARVASGLTAQAGPQNGFGGGETLSISPMSSASAPAQCKSREDKASEKMQISAPTQAQIATAGYHNAALSSSELRFAQKSGATEHGVAVAQMLGGMQDPAFMQRVVSHTGSSEEEIRKEMGSLVGSQYASRALQLDPHGSDIAQRDAAMFRGSDLEHLNLGKFLQGELAGSMGGTFDAVRNSTMTQVENDGRIETSLDPSMVDAQIRSLGTMAASSPTAMSAVDGFLRGMRQGGSDLSDQHLEGKISNEVFLRGITPVFARASTDYTGEDRKKLVAMGNNLQSKINKSHINLAPGRMAQVAPVPAPAPQAAPAAPVQEEALPEEGKPSDPVHKEAEEAPADQRRHLSPYEELMGYVNRTGGNRVIPREFFDEMTDERGHMLDTATIAAQANAASPPYSGMREMFNERRAAQEAQLPGYEGVKRIFSEPRVPNPDAETTMDEMLSMFDPKTMPRRDARAATQAREQESFSGTMRSVFDEEAAALRESGLPHAPGMWDDDVVGGFGDYADLEDEAPNFPRMVSQDLIASPPHPALQAMMNLSDDAENKLMQNVRILDPANDPPPFPAPAPAPAPAPKKKRWWQFWR